jgi:CCR4-NOT transcription complex subunit 9
MDNGSELSKTVATFIIQKILLDEMGLSYICATYERFHTVSAVLTKMVRGLEERPSVRLLKHIVRVYLRLSENGRARDALRTMLPPRLRDGTFAELLKDDPVTKRWLSGLLSNIGAAEAAAAVPAPRYGMNQ